MEKMESGKKQPLSLNQRHNRILSDLSASHHKQKPHSTLPTSSCNPSYSVEDVKFPDCNEFSLENECDGAPCLSGIADFGSPFRESSSKNENFACSPNNVPSFDGIADADSSSALFDPTEQSETDYGSCIEEEKGLQKRPDRVDPLPMLPDKLPAEHKKVNKVKIEGRRRLCRISSKDDNKLENKTENEVPNVEEIADFGSPSPQRDVPQRGCGGRGNEILDILNDLTSRLDELSIKKTGASNKPEPNEYFEDSRGSQVSNVNKQKEVHQNRPVDLSLSPGLETLSYSSKVSKKVALVQNEFEDYHSKSGTQDAYHVSKDSRVIRDGGSEKDPLDCSNAKSESAEQSFHSNLLKTDGTNDDYDDDCVVITGEKVKQAWRGTHAAGAALLSKYSDNSFAQEDHSITFSNPTSAFRLPSKVSEILYPHQRDGLKWLWSLHCQNKGGVLGDDMGLGKTMQICAFLAGLFHSNLIKRALIVAPKTLLPHWINELTVVGLSGKTREYYGTCAKARQYELQYILQDGGILLTTYDILRNNFKSLRGDYDCLDENEDDIWDYVILDEGHFIKNPSTQRSKSLHEIPCAHRIIISGTPLQNNLNELWALFDFCCPGLLGDKKRFKEMYEKPILRGSDKKASTRDKHIGSTMAKELRERIQPYFLRRLKSEVFHEDAQGDLKLSKKNEMIVWLRLTSCQRKLYEAFLRSEIVLSAFDHSPLAAITILKKICDHPLLLTKRAAEEVLEGMNSMSDQDKDMAEKLALHLADLTERFDFRDKDVISCKTSFIMSLLGELIPSGHNVLIFSQTRKMLNLIQDSLTSCGYRFMRIDGTTKASDRVKIVNDFQEARGASIFLLTSQVGGLGLTLTRADRVIVVDPAWNPSTDNQSVDRAYRIGQNKDVIVYRLMTCGTVEEKIYRKQVFKGGLFKTATEHKEQIRYFSQQDLRDLFSLPKEGFDISLTQKQLNEEHDWQNMEQALAKHIKFLETLGIAGVSDHSLLFSKAATVPDTEEEDFRRVKTTAFTGNSSFSSALERDVNGAEYAFNPKDVKSQKKSSLPKASKPTESEIKEKINRLSRILSDKVTLSKLPDKGEKLQKHMDELYGELHKIRSAQSSGNENFSVENVSDSFERILIV